VPFACRTEAPMTVSRELKLPSQLTRIEKLPRRTMLFRPPTVCQKSRYAKLRTACSDIQDKDVVAPNQSLGEARRSRRQLVQKGIVKRTSSDLFRSLNINSN
jgi:hypothetical protein